MTQAAIEFVAVSKKYGATRALDGLDLEVARGEVFGLVGVNGAGKTTTLSLVMGFIRASSGVTRVLGLDAWSNASVLHARIAWLPGDVRLPDAPSGREWLRYQAHVLGIEYAKIHLLAQDWEVPLERPLRTLSKGNRQKIALLRLLAADADLLVLDEPTSGLDPIAQEKLLSLLRERARTGTTVLFSSHSLAEVQSLCDRIAVIDNGRVLQTGTIAALTAGTHTLSVWTREPIDLHGLELWKPQSIGPRHVILEGERLLEDALPQIVHFGVERAEFAGIGLERLLGQTHHQGVMK